MTPDTLFWKIPFSGLEKLCHVRNHCKAPTQPRGDGKADLSWDPRGDWAEFVASQETIEKLMEWGWIWRKGSALQGQWGISPSLFTAILFYCGLPLFESVQGTSISPILGPITTLAKTPTTFALCKCAICRSALPKIICNHEINNRLVSNSQVVWIPAILNFAPPGSAASVTSL